MKEKISDINIGDLVYSKRSSRIATAIEVYTWGFVLQWNKARYTNDEIRNTYAWCDWYGPIPEEYLIFTTEQEKLAAILKYGS